MKTNSSTVVTTNVETLNVTRKWTLTDDSETSQRAFANLFAALSKQLFLAVLMPTDSRTVERALCTCVEINFFFLHSHTIFSSQRECKLDFKVHLSVNNNEITNNTERERRCFSHREINVFQESAKLKNRVRLIGNLLAC